jgi:hypothetical protein
VSTTDSKALVPHLPIAVQTRAAAVPIDQAEAMLPAIQATWPKDVAANPVMQRMIARIAIAYGLDPLMGELIPYQGKPYVTIEGRLRKAQEHEAYRGLECRPATEQEREAFRCGPNDHLWRAEVYRADWPKPVIGWGRVRSDEGSPVAKQHPQLMAEKRAKARALRDAFSIPLPSAEDAAEYNPAPMQYVDQGTGEIVDTPIGGVLASAGHKAAIHSLCKALGISEEDRHAHLAAMFQKGATNELTEGEAASYLEFLAAVEAAEEAKRPEVIEAALRASAYYVPEAGRPQPTRFRTVPGWGKPPAVFESEPTEAEFEEIQEQAESETEPLEDDPAEPTRAEQPRSSMTAGEFAAAWEEKLATMKTDEIAQETFNQQVARLEAKLLASGLNQKQISQIVKRLTGKASMTVVTYAQLRNFAAFIDGGALGAFRLLIEDGEPEAAGKGA